jgi:hypothetical protein
LLHCIEREFLDMKCSFMKSAALKRAPFHRGAHGVIRVIFDVFRVHAAGMQSGKKSIFTGFQRENTLRHAIKKQHTRVKKHIFRLEKRMFSSSIANASVEAVLRW